MDDIVRIDSNLPATKNAPTKFAQYRQLVSAADEILARHNAMEQIQQRLDDFRSWTVDLLPEPRTYEVKGRVRELLSRCQQLMSELDPDSYYDGDRLILKRKIIKSRLAVMLGSLLQANNSTPEVFPQQLLNHVADEPGLTYLALESACRELEGESKWTPTIADVLERIRKHDKLWTDRIWAIDAIELIAHEIAASVAEMKPKIEADQKTRVIGRARARWASARNKVRLKRLELVKKQQIVADLAQQLSVGLSDLQILEEEVRSAEAALIAAGGDPAEDPAKSNVGGI